MSAAEHGYGATVTGGELNDLASIRAWINAMYPDTAILIQRNVQGTPKPFFFIEHVDDRFQDRGIGWNDALRTWRIHLVSEGADAGAPGGPSTLKASRRALDFIAARLKTERVIPRYAYDLPYPPAAASVLQSGGSFPLGDHRFAVSAVDDNGVETLLSEPETQVPVTAANWRVFLQVPNWPTQRPLAQLYWVWHREGPDGHWTPVGSVPPVITQRYTTEIEVGSALDPVDRDPLPESCRLRLGHLKVQEATGMLTESFLDDNAFRGNVTLKALSRDYHVRRPAPPLNGVTVAYNPG